ncbi:MAG: serine/threonine-protein kinase, partial [Lacipirellulaceae bacterium]
RDAGNQSLTQAGVAMGTPLYMSPEQIESRGVDLRSDLYSLGVTAYHLLAGQPPHTGETALAIAVQHLNVAPKPLSEVRDDIPAGLVEVVERLMAKLPEERYASPGELLTDLRELATAAQGEGWGDGPENWPLAEWITGPNGTVTPSGNAATVASTRSTTRKLNAAMKTLAMLQPPKNSRRRKVAIIAGALMAGFILSIVTRPRNYLREREPSSVVKRDTAWAQIYQANLAPSEEAWLAVGKNFPDADPYEKLLADQGLVRYYLLLDENNKKALAKLRELDSQTQSADTRLSTKAFIKAALVVTEHRLGNATAARTELGKLTPQMSDLLRESDRRLYELLQTTRGELGQ